MRSERLPKVAMELSSPTSLLQELTLLCLVCDPEALATVVAEVDISTLILALSSVLKGESKAAKPGGNRCNDLILNYFRPVQCDLPHTTGGQDHMGRRGKHHIIRAPMS